MVETAVEILNEVYVRESIPCVIVGLNPTIQKFSDNLSEIARGGFPAIVIAPSILLNTAEN
jgi:hypothetical protein